MPREKADYSSTMLMEVDAPRRPSLNSDQNIKHALALWGMVETSPPMACVGVQKSDNIKNEMSRSQRALCKSPHHSEVNVNASPLGSYTRKYIESEIARQRGKNRTVGLRRGRGRIRLLLGLGLLLVSLVLGLV